MRFLGLFALLVLLMFVPAGPALSADPTPELTVLDRIGGASADVATGNGYTYVGDGYGIVTFDGRGATPAGLGRIVLPAPVRRLHLNGTTLAAVNGGQVTLLDLSDPELPAIRSSYRGDADVFDAQVAGNLLALATGGGVVETLDISDLSNPQPLDQLTIDGGVGNIVLDGTRLIAEGGCFADYALSYCVTVVNVADPTALAIDGARVQYESLVLSGMQDTRLAVSGDLAVVSGTICCRFGQSAGWIYVINLATREVVGRTGWVTEDNPALEPIARVSPSDVAIVGGAVLVSTDIHGLTVFSLSATERPARLRDVVVPLPLTGLAVQGTQGYVGLADGGVLPINLSDPLQPVPGAPVRLLGPVTGIAAAGADLTDLLVTSGSGAQAQLTRFQTDATGGLTPGTPVSVPNGNLFAGPGNIHALVNRITPPYSLRLVDASGTVTPTLSAPLTIAYPTAIALGVPYVYLGTDTWDAEAETHILQLEVAQFAADAAPELVTSLPVEVPSMALIVEDGRLYRLSTTAFEVYDLANPAAPAFLGSVPLPTPDYVAPALAVMDGVAYIGFREEGTVLRLQVIDARNPANPTLGSVVAENLRISTLLVAGERLFVGGVLPQTGVRQYDLSDPLVPTLVAEASLYDEPQHIVASGAGVAVAAYESGVTRLALLNERLWLPLAAR